MIYIVLNQHIRISSNQKFLEISSANLKRTILLSLPPIPYNHLSVTFKKKCKSITSLYFFANESYTVYKYINIKKQNLLRKYEFMHFFNFLPKNCQNLSFILYLFKNNNQPIVIIFRHDHPMYAIDEIVPYKFVRSKNGKVFKLSNSWRNLVPRSFRCL